MKKKYVKPELFFESFEMNTAIANCGWRDGTNHGNVLECELVLSAEDIVFVQSNTDCIWTPDKFNICYDVPTANDIVFYS